MLALSLHKGLNFFWSPNFDSKPKTGGLTSVQHLRRKELRKRGIRCKIMRALQRSLSEAQKIGVGVDALKGLIKTHKASCAKCCSSK